MHIINTIEMFGLCSSGKSTIQSECNIDKIVTVNNPTPISRLYIYVFTIYIALRMFIISPTILIRFLYDYKNRKLLVKLGFRVAGIFKRRNMYRHNDIFLRDSGVLMPFVSAIIEQEWEWKKSYVLLFFSVIPIPKKVVFVSVKPTVAHIRYIRRNKKGISQVFFYSADDCCQFLCTLLKSKGVDLIKVDNNISVDCTFLSNRLENR